MKTVWAITSKSIIMAQITAATLKYIITVFAAAFTCGASVAGFFAFLLS
jgi:hypothetical protein